MIENKKYITDHEGNIIQEITLDISWEEIRRVRTKILNDTDWRAVKDRTMSQAWKDYRKFLRDLPQDFTDSNAAVEALNQYDIPE
jgi:hypothetical protein